MQKAPTPDPNVAALIDQLLQTKDPAVVGLRRILKTKRDEGASFPCRKPVMEEFESAGKSRTIFSEDEKRVIELEKQVKQLQAEVAENKAHAERSVKAALEEGLRKGFEKGRTAGVDEAREAADKQVAALQARIGDVLKSFEESKRKVYANAEHVLLKFSCALAKKIINTELSVNSDIALAAIKKALGYVADRDKIIVRVAPQDFESASGRKDFWSPVGEGLTAITIEKDERIDRGSCVVESNSGVADARLGVQFDELNDLVEKVWQNVHSSPDGTVDT